MNIKKYAAYFHDGGLIDIDHQHSKMVLSMNSAEMDPDDFEEDLNLSKDDYMRGKLHIEGVKEVYVNDKLLSKHLKKEHDYGEIFDLEIKDNIVTLVAAWVNVPPKEFLHTDFFKYKIVAENVYWEPIPDLHDPFWE